MRAWLNWRNPLIILQPETLIGWQRAGFRMFWRWKSRRRLGRPEKDQELIQLIRRMWSTNPTWGSPRIRDELAKLGLLRDHDSIYGSIFVQRVKGMGIQQKLTAPRSPWQNPFAERLIGSIRRECLDRVIVLNEQQLGQILEDYIAYYHRVSPHRSFSHDSPIPRPVESPDRGKVIEMPRVGGLHHQYLRQAA